MDGACAMTLYLAAILLSLLGLYYSSYIKDEDWLNMCRTTAVAVLPLSIYFMVNDYILL